MPTLIGSGFIEIVPRLSPTFAAQIEGQMVAGTALAGAGAIKSAESAGAKAGTGFLGGMRTGLAGMGTMVKSVVGIAAAFGVFEFAKKSVEAFKDVAGSSITLQRVMGGSITQASEWAAVSARFGLSTGQMSVSMKTLAKDMVAGKGPLVELGIASKDSTGHLRPMGDVMMDIADKFHAMPDGALKSRLAVELFGKSGLALLPMLNRGSGGLQDLMNEAKKLGLVLDSNSTGTMRKAVEAQRNLNEAVKGLEVQFGEKLVPVLTSFVQFLSGTVIPILGSIMGFFERNSTAVKIFATALLGLWSATKLVSAAQAGYNTILTIYHGVAAGATLAARGLAIAIAMRLGPISLIVVGIAAAVAAVILLWSHWDQVWNWIAHHKAYAIIIGVLGGTILLPIFALVAAIKFLQSNWSGIWAVIQAVAQTVSSSIVAALQALQRAWNTVWGAMAVVIGPIWTGIRAAVSEGMSVVQNAISVGMTVIHAVWRAAWTVISTIFNAVWNAIKTEAHTAMEIVRTVISAGMTVIRAVWGPAWTVLSTLFTVAWTAIRAAVSVGMTVIQGVISAGMTVIRAVWGAAWAVISTALSAAWVVIGPIVRVGMAAIQTIISAGMTVIRAVWGPAWTAISAVLSAAWAVIGPIVRVGMTAIQTVINAGMVALRALWSAAWAVFATPLTAAWTVIRTVVSAGMTAVSAVISAAMTVLRALWSAAWTVMSTLVTAAWAVIRPIVQTGMTVISTVISAGMTVVRTLWSAAWTVMSTLVTAAWAVIRPIVQTGMTVLSTIISAGMTAIRTLWNAAWTVISTLMTTVWTAIRTVVQAGVTAVSTIITTTWNAVRAVFTTVWNAISAAFTAVWNVMRATATVATNAISATVTTVWNAVRAFFTTVWNAISAFFTAIWNTMKATTSAALNAINSTVQTVWNAVRAFWIALWNAISAFFTAIWNTMKATALAALNWINSTLQTVWNAVRAFFISIWNAISSFFTAIWNTMKATALAALNSIHSTVQTVWNAVHAVFTSVWTAISSFFTGIWNTLKATASAAINAISSVISSVLNSIKSAWSTAWTAMRDALSTIWSAIKEIFAAPVRVVLKIVGGFDHIVNTIAGFVGLHPNLPENITIPGLQRGKKLPGYGGGDIVPAMLEPGEAVVPKHLVGEIAPWAKERRIPGFQTGGVVSNPDGLGPNKPTLSPLNSMGVVGQNLGIPQPIQSAVGGIVGIATDVLDVLKDAGKWIWATGLSVLRTGASEVLKGMLAGPRAALDTVTRPFGNPGQIVDKTIQKLMDAAIEWVKGKEGPDPRNANGPGYSISGTWDPLIRTWVDYIARSNNVSAMTYAGHHPAENYAADFAVGQAGMVNTAPATGPSGNDLYSNLARWVDAHIINVPSPGWYVGTHAAIHSRERAWHPASDQVGRRGQTYAHDDHVHVSFDPRGRSPMIGIPANSSLPGVTWNENGAAPVVAIPTPPSPGGVIGAAVGAAFPWNQSQMEAAMLQVGAPANIAHIFSAIGMAENPASRPVHNQYGWFDSVWALIRTWTTSLGYDINRLNSDIVYAAGAAYRLYQLRGFAPWEAYTGGTYARFLAQGGLVKSYDAGGYLPPGLSVAYNGTGKPEPVGGGVQNNTVNLTMHIANGDPVTMRAAAQQVVDDALTQLARRLSSGAGRN